MVKAFLKLTLIIPFFLFIAIINYKIDPYNFFKKTDLKLVAKSIIDGNNITNVNEIDERSLQLFIIQNLKIKYDYIALGSSRIMQLRQDFFMPSTFFNNGVSAATLEDFLFIYGFYKERDLLPKNIILSIDPWLFNKNHNFKRWYPIAGKLKKIEKKYYRLNAIKWHKNHPIWFNLVYYFQLFDPSVFKESIRHNNHSSIKITKQTRTKFRTKLSDGSRSYEYLRHNRTEAQVDSIIKEEIKRDYSFGLENFELDEKLYQVFEIFLKTLINDSVKINIVLVPYHPDFYHFMLNSDNYKNIVFVEDYIKNIAAKNNIAIYGSYDMSNLYNLNKKDFYDPYHPNEEGIKKVLYKLKVK